MSGVEVAGIILSLWPVITTLAAAYKDARTGENLQKLAKEVEVSEVIYKNCLRSLLLCDDYLPEEEILKLLGSVDGADMAWKQPSVQQKLRDALSDKTCDSIDFALTEIHAAMGILEKSLRKGEVDVASFRGRVRISIMQTKARNPHSNFQQALIRLTKNVSLLRDLISMPKLLPSSQRAREEKGGGRPVSEARRKSVPPQHTNNFFKAIKEGLQKCTCEDGHDTSLRVNCEDYFHIVLGIHDPNGDLTELSLRARSTFDTGITTLGGEVGPEDDENPTDEIQSPLPTVLTEKESRTTLTGVTSCWSPRSRNDSMSSTLQSQHAVQMSFSTDNPKAAGSTPRDALDLCVLLRNLSSTQPTSTRPSEPLRSFGTLRRGDTIYTARGEPKVLPAVSIECLDDRLKNLCDCRLRKRVEIAQSLAFAVVQFWSTEWIDASWTWRSFSVREDTRGIQLFVTKRILPDRAEKNPAEEPAKFWKLIREPMLVRLGFALIELALAKRLSELRAEAGEDESEAGLSEDEKDYYTARRVLDTKQLEEDCSSTYQAVVEACLTCDVAKDSSYLSLTSRAPSFQDDVDTHVVQPLRHYFERTWVTVQA